MICALLLAFTAHQVPEVVVFSAVLDEDGIPVDREVSLRLTIYDAAVGGTAWWTQAWPALGIRQGALDVELGTLDDNPLPAAIFAGPRWLEIVIDGVTLAPRARLATAPYAMHAASADVCSALDGEVDRTQLAGEEQMLFRGLEACGLAGAVLLSSTCTTVLCDTNRFRSCDGSCASPVPRLCPLVAAGFMLGL